jgi:hypothetical protein
MVVLGEEARWRNLDNKTSQQQCHYRLAEAGVRASEYTVKNMKPKDISI